MVATLSVCFPGACSSLAQPRSAKQTRSMKCLALFPAAELQHVALAAFAFAALKARLPAPNLPVERTC